MTKLAVINESKGIQDSVVQGYLSAFTTQWNKDLDPVWGVGQASFTFVPKGQKPAPGTWWVVFLDNSDQADALAYHDLTNEGLPISKVFVESINKEKSSVSVGATHEICEMAVDPWLNSAYQDPQGTFWAGEICDPVEDDQYGYEIGGVLVTDFVTPNWFGHQHAQTQMDLKNHSKSAFSVLTGGYAQKFDPSAGGWQQITGDKAKASQRALHPQKGTRRDRRIKTEGHRGRFQIVVDRFRHANALDARFLELHRRAHGAIASDDDERLDL